MLCRSFHLPAPSGEYVEALGPFLGHQGVECCCVLLRAWRGNGVLLNEALQVIVLWRVGHCN